LSATLATLKAEAESTLMWALTAHKAYNTPASRRALDAAFYALVQVNELIAEQEAAASAS
jgi:hypothetical protein